MTLARQLILVVSALFLLVFVGSFIISLHNTREFLVDQLESHATDTATSLGLSIKPYLKENDTAMMRTMVNAIFDRGYYREIRILKMDGAPIIERVEKPRVKGVPEWFTNMVHLDTPRGQAVVNVGWKPTAKVMVRSHPGYAYNQLWRSGVAMLWWSLGSLAVALMAVSVLFHFVLKPLKAVENQALAIASREFPIVDKTPRTRELRRVTMAMNKMSRKVELMLLEQTELAERLRKDAYEDLVTGLENRRSFRMRLDYFTNNKEEFSHGALVLARMANMEEYNADHGYEEGDELLRGAARTLRRKLVMPDVVTFARINGAEFGAVINGVSIEEADQLGQAINHELRLAGAQESSANPWSVGVGYYRPSMSAAELMSRADMALRTAEQKDQGAFRLYDSQVMERGRARGAFEWKAILEKVIRERNMLFHYQPAISASDGSVLRYEALARIRLDDGAIARAGAFMPMAKRFGLIESVDRLAVELLLDRISGTTADDERYSINLSSTSVANPEFSRWLRESIKKYPAVVSKIAFEMSEYGAAYNMEATKALADGLRPLGVGFALDHFGSGATSFGYLRSLKLEYMKIDGSLIRNIHNDKDNQFYVKAMSDIAHGLDIKVIGEFVENEEDWDTLADLRLDGGQGFFIGEPIEKHGL